VNSPPLVTAGEELESRGCPEQKVRTGSGEVPDDDHDELVGRRAASRAAMRNSRIM
jgi:hypothetical protein